MNSQPVDQETCSLAKRLKTLVRSAILAVSLLPTTLFADAIIYDVTQSPDSPVLVGETVNYSVLAGFVDSPFSLFQQLEQLDSAFINIEITLNGVSFSRFFDSNDSQCGYDGIYFCGEINVDERGRYGFSWTPPAVGTYEIGFIVGCGRCGGSAREFISTVVVEEEILTPGYAQIDGLDLDVNEGETALVTINRVDGSDGELTASILVGGEQDSARSGIDYQPPESTQVVFADGETTMRVPIVTLEDSLVEDTETISVFLVSPEGRPVFAHAIFIRDNTRPGQLAFDTASSRVSEGEDLVLTVVRTGGSDGRIGVDVVLGDADDSSSPDDIVVPESVYLDFGDGVTSRTLRVPVRDDGIAEGEEMLTARLQPACCDDTAVSIGEPSVQRVTIIDGVVPVPGNLRFSTASAEVDEGTTVTLIVERVDGSDGRVFADLVFGGESDSASNDDYTSPSETRLFFEDGQTSREFDVFALSDEQVEGNESLSIRLVDDLDSAAGVIAPAVLDLVLVDKTRFEPGRIDFEASSFTVQETEGPASIVLVRSDGGDGAVSARVVIGSEGDSATVGEDYTLPSSTEVIWQDGEAGPRSLEIPIIADALIEEDERLSLTFVIEGDAAVGEISSSTLTISNVNPFRPGRIDFEARSFTVQETEGPASIVLVRSDGGDGAVSARVVIGNEGDSATVGEDYTLPSSTEVIWQDGEAGPRFLEIPIIADDLIEEDERLSLTFVIEGDAAVGEISSSTLTISNVNPLRPGRIDFEASSFTVQETEGPASIVLVRSDGRDGAVSARVVIGSEGDSATVGEDYTLPSSTEVIWQDGEAGPRVLEIPIIADALIEEDERLSLTFVIEGDAAVGEISSSTLTITNVIPPRPGIISFAAESFSVTVEAGEIDIVASRMDGADGRLEVDVQIGSESDTAVLGEHYNVLGDTNLVWTDGDVANKNIRIEVFTGETAAAMRQLSLALVAVGETTLGTPSEATLLINEVIGNPETVRNFDVVSGDNQFGDQGEVLEPMVVRAVDAAGGPVSAITIEWTITPENAASLRAGTTTSTDADGATSNTVTLNTDQFVVVTARAIGGDAEPATFRINGLIPVDDLSRNQLAVLDGLTNACDVLNSQEQVDAEQADLLATCELLTTLEAPEELLDLLAPDEVGAQGVSLVRASNLQVMNVRTRLNVLRSGASGVDVSGVGLTVDGVPIPSLATEELMSFAVGGAASSDVEVTDYKRLGGFITGEISIGSRDRSRDENGFEFRALDFTAGIDYRLSSDVVAGLALGFGGGDSEFATAAGDLDESSFHITGYGTWYHNQRLYVDGVIEYGAHDFTNNRRVSLSGSPLQNAQSETSGNTLSMSLSAGYIANFQAWNVGTYGRIVSTDADVDAYDERAEFEGVGGIGSMLHIGRQSIDSLTFAVGLEVSYAISLADGVIEPQARFEWEHESSDDQREIDVHFLADPTSTTFTLVTDEPDRDYFNFGLGFSLIAAGGKSSFLFYETRLDQDNVEQHWLRTGFRFEF